MKISILLTKYKSGKYVLIFDNASCHVSKETLESIKLKKFNVLTLPPYSPYYNLAEYVFNWLKNNFTAWILEKVKIFLYYDDF